MKALIIYKTGATEPNHSNLVKDAFIAGGGVNADLYNIASFNQSVIDYAKTNNYDAIIYSYSGEDGYFNLSNSNPGVMIFMPSDSYNGDLQQLVLTDYTPTTDDYEFCTTYGGSQSNANGYIAGQLFYIASQRNCSLQEARICANATKSEDGIIDVNAAIAYTGTIALTVGTLTAVRGTGFSTTLTLERIIDATNYRIKIIRIDDSFLQYLETTSLIYTYTLPDYGIYLFSYQGYSTDLESNYSDEVQEGWSSFQFFLISEEEMDYGSAISNYDIQIGSYGTSIKVDITDYLPDEIISVQAENLDGVRSDVVLKNSDYSALQGYIEDVSCPEVAWNYSSNILTVFFANHSGGDEWTRFAFAGYHFPQIFDSSNLLDMNPNDLELLKCYVLRDLYADNNMMLPYEIRTRISYLEEKLANEV